MKSILTVQAGSRAYGCHTEDSDYDQVQIVIESLEDRMHIGKVPFESSQHKTDEGDTHVYSLETFCKLASQGNPNMVEVLYCPVLQYTSEGNELIENRHLFWSKQAGARFLGYMKAQKERLLGLRGQKDVNRPELVEKYGYDTKYAYHIIRLGYIGNEFLTSGYMGLPFRGLRLQNLKDIRAGKWTLEEVTAKAEELEQHLKYALDYGPAPHEPDTLQLSNLLRRAYLSHWCVNFTY